MESETRTIYATEFKGRCVCCKREVDVLSKRIIGDGLAWGEHQGTKASPGLVFARHLAGDRGWCAGSLGVYARV